MAAGFPERRTDQRLDVVRRRVDRARDRQAPLRQQRGPPDLDAVARHCFSERGARSGPALDYGYPGTICISLNDEAVHGIPGVRIEDSPRLRWRGLMLDSARQYQSVNFIKRYIDFMALHKLNVLHWHLIDDHAWRLNIPKYPKLTGGMSSYSAEDVRAVVAHAAARNVMVVPGLQMPGGATAAVTAYPSLRAAAFVGVERIRSAARPWWVGMTWA